MNVRMVGTMRGLRADTGKTLVRNPAALLIVALVLALGGCGGGGEPIGTHVPAPTPTPTPTPPPTSSDPAYYLDQPRFTTHQPDVLERINAHHAYADQLTGAGIRIGIDDTIVDYTQIGEFGNRVRLSHADGAVLSYRRPDGDNFLSEVQTCQLFDTCHIFRGDSEGDPETFNYWVQEIVANRGGWPVEDDSVFIVDDHYSAFDEIGRLLRWTEVPTPYGREGSHGTIVASIAAGKTLGVAPGATIIPVANNLTNDQRAERSADEVIRAAIMSLPSSDREELDDIWAREVRENYANFDIINRSYGISIFDPEVISREIASELAWYDTYLPKYLSAHFQVGTPDAEKTILVYAAGNDGEAYSGIGADLPYYLPMLRGYSLSVAATDPSTGLITDFSNRCGPLPPDWNAEAHGPHYCLAAPGIVRGLVPNPATPGRGDVQDGIAGTSFAAPVVSGALALLMEHFRGTRGNTQVVKRMLDTADRTGRYADLETYGAGHLDLEAALSPVGSLDAGQGSHALARTTLQMPTAFGAIAQRVGDIELAAFDEQAFPFWVPLSALIYGPPAVRSPIPQFETPDAVTPTFGLNALELHWTSLDGAVPGSQADAWTWVAGFAPTSAGLASRSPDGGWEYGLGFDDESYLGTRASGAFGGDIRSGTVWASRTVRHDLGAGIGLDATGILAVSAPHYEENAIFEASPVALSALAVRVGTSDTGLTIEQPLRAESGTGTFRVENGWTEDGRRLYDAYRVRLSPDAREVRMTLRHELDAVGGRVAVEVGGSLNAGHVAGEEETRVGVAYRTAW